jgi:hypothetical protein
VTHSLFINEKATGFTVEPAHTSTPLATLATQADAVT